MVDPVAIRLASLTVSYRHGRGVTGLDLEMATGSVFGFLGPNGAGKTTAIRTLLDLLRPTSGSATVLGLDSVRDSMEIRRRTGYLPGDFVLPPQLTGAEALDWLASLRADRSPERRGELVERLGVELHRPIRQLSKGNRQKLGLVQAFQHDPELVILDEPTSGLDPLVQDEFHRLVREHAARGRSVFLSSHSLDEVQHVADTVGIIREGSMVAVESVDALRARGLRRMTIRVADAAAAQRRLQDLPAVSDLRVSGDHLDLAVSGSFDELLPVLAELHVLDLLSRAADLDEIFLAFYRGESTP